MIILKTFYIKSCGIYKKTNRNKLFILILIIFSSIGECTERNRKSIERDLPGQALDFLHQNGKKFLTFTSLDTNNLDTIKTMNSLYRESKLRPHMRSRKIEINVIKSLHNFEQDTLVIVTSSKAPNWKQYLSIIAKTKILSSIVVCIGDITEKKMGEIKSFIRALSENMSFYWIKIGSDSSHIQELNQIFSMKGSNQINMKPVKFDQLGYAMVEQDLGGLHINCSTLDWYPYFKLKDCRGSNHTNCSGEGYMADIMNIMAKRLNFSWSCDKEPYENWGHLSSISGPKNASGVWGGVQGLVRNGTYPLSVSTWRNLDHRIGIFDFVNAGTGYKEIIAYNPRAPTFDPKLFLRPFSSNVWTTIGFTYLSAVSIYSISGRFTKNNFNPNQSTFSASKLIFFVAWINHFLIVAWYDGALTMFFADEAPTLFTSKMDMMKAYPDWKLNVKHDDQLEFHVHADEGDETYQLYLQIMKDLPKELICEDFDECIQRMMNGQNGMYGSENGFRLYFKENPSEIRPTTIPFQEMFHENLVLTHNSPLYPYLSEVALEMHEKGIFNILERRWYGKRLKQESVTSLHTVVLGIGQMILIYLMLGIAIVVSILVMAIEILFNRIISGKIKEVLVAPCWDKTDLEESIQNTTENDVKSKEDTRLEGRSALITVDKSSKKIFLHERDYSPLPQVN